MSITLPRYNSLTVNEMLFLEWASKEYKHLAQGLNSSLAVVQELKEFCHRFICLRLKLASWEGDSLLFAGEPLTTEQTMMGADGQLLPIYMMYLIYGFATDEQGRWLGVKKPDMVETVLRSINQSIGETSGESSTGGFNKPTQEVPSSQELSTDTAPLTSLPKPSKASKKAA